MSRVELLVAVLLMSACGVEPEGPAVARQAIVGGVDDAEDPAVVALVVSGFPSCTGTLISPVAVLTAGHCANVLGPGVEYQVAFGSDAARPGRRVVLETQVLHPDYTKEGAPYDFALARLSAPVTDVSPIPLASAPLTAADLGTLVRHVGFGVSDETAMTGRGAKRQVTYAITEVDPLVVWSGGPGQQTCNGDSGGPALLTRGGVEELVGVVSDGPNCHDAGWDGRVDVVTGWIHSTVDGWMPDAGPAVTPPHTGCASAGFEPSMLGALTALSLVRRRRGRAGA